MQNINNKALENKLRRKAKQCGFLLRKSRASISIDNLGEYMLVDMYKNAIVAGEKFDLTLSDVEEFLE